MKNAKPFRSLILSLVMIFLVLGSLQVRADDKTYSQKTGMTEVSQPVVKSR